MELEPSPEHAGHALSNSVQALRGIGHAAAGMLPLASEAGACDIPSDPPPYACFLMSIGLSSYTGRPVFDPRRRAEARGRPK